ncbi:putative aminohydrolase SsnA [candidate division CSSED10-310 bacterium]|uniref:Aminohydrolase SsnA n=1 Tax=candidate division CSSED10-310 bacterium TaxID=2855610 RepID=A0ABV6YU73_UNCC1
MTDAIIYNANIVTFTRENPYHPGKALLIEGHKIKEIGEYRDISKRFPKTRRINAQNGFLLPGMINAHTHLYSTFARGMMIEVAIPTFPKILENVWWKLDRALTEEDCYYSAEVGIIESIRHGVTTIIDHHSSPQFIEGSLDVMAQAFQKTAVRGVLSYEVSDRNGLAGAEAGIEENCRFLKKLETDSEPLLRALFGLHASFTLSDNTLDKCAQAGHDRKAGFHFHLAEDRIDTEDSWQQYGIPIHERFTQREIFNTKSIVAHGVHLPEESFPALADTKTTLVHNPQSNMNNAVGCTPLLNLYENNVFLCLGTDGMTPDIREEIRCIPLIQSHHHKIPGAGLAVSKTIVLENQSKLVSNLFGNSIGLIAPGYQADLIILDYSPPTPVDEHNFFNHLIWGMSRSKVNFVMIDGRIIMKDGHLIGIDEQRIYERGRELARDVWERFKKLN